MGPWFHFKSKEVYLNLTTTLLVRKRKHMPHWLWMTFNENTGKTTKKVVTNFNTITNTMYFLQHNHLKKYLKDARSSPLQ